MRIILVQKIRTEIPDICEAGQCSGNRTKELVRYTKVAPATNVGITPEEIAVAINNSGLLGTSKQPV